ncbi:MAG: ORF6N domain-containing protein [Bacteroidales bacterium]|nr:ORF6N domain-containing protein [Bacteroidales bacterium]
MNNLQPVQPISVDNLKTKIYEFRGQKVMLDRDLAALYQVETKRLNEAVKRNILRFPADFMFQLNDSEFQNWKSQFATSNSIKFQSLHEYLENILTTQNDINDDTAAQLELINKNLAELQAENTIRNEFAKRKPVGFKIEK